MTLAWRQRLRTTTALQAVAAAALLATPLPALAQLSPNARPTGGQVVAGQASIGQSATATTISQSSQRAAVNWQGFDVGSQQTVQFQQPSSSAVTLNRVVGPNPSEIAGRIQANGQLVVVNQSGVVFDSGAQVNAAGLVVSAAGISDKNFMAGKMVFDQAAQAGAKIENRGTITVKDHGLAALVAPQVRNAGTIAAKLGTVVLAGAEAETLDLYGDGLVSINVTKQVRSAPDGAKALVTNTGVVSAQGGTVVLTADAVDGVVQTLVDAGGRISANSTAGQTGTVLISGSGGDVRVDGVVSAQGKVAGATGGSVMISGSGATIVGAKARISAAGQAGGGTIALGTTLARAAGGSGTAAATTGRLVVKKGAVVSADATARGNGGRVTLLAANATTMAGTISAKGGAAGGNGGAVEISGGTVNLTGHVDATAPMGAIGTLLLDPSDLWVSDTRPSVATYTITSGDLPTVSAGGAPNLATVSWVSPTLLASQNANISLAASDDLYVASSYGKANTLNLGSYTLTLTGGTGLTVDHGFSINASAVSLTTQSGAITLDSSSGVTAGLITAPQLAMLSDTAITASTLTLAGAGGIALGGAKLGTALNPLTQLDLSTSGNGVTQDAGGAIYATQLGGASKVAGAVNLAGTANDIANLGSFVAGAGFALTDTATTLTVLGPVNGGTGITLANTGTLALKADLVATGTVTLDAADIQQYVTTVITAGELTGDAGAGYASFGGTNKVQQLGAFTAQDGFGLIDDSPSLKVTGAIDGGAGGVYLVNSGSLVIAAPLTSSGNVELYADGITQTAAGVITAGTLSGDAGAGAAHLGIATNAVTDLDLFNATQGFGLRDNAPVLTVTSAVDGGASVYLVNTGSVVLAAPVTATGVVDLVGNGITQDSGGTITAGTLIGNAGPGAAHLGVAANAVTDLGAFTAGQGFGLNDATPKLTVTGAVDGGTSVYLVTTGSLAINAPITASGTVDLVGNGIAQTAAGTITAGTLTGNAGTGAAHLGIAANAVTTLGAFTADQGFGLNDAVPLLTVAGAVHGGPAVYLVNTGSLALNAPITASGLVDLVGNGIAQTAAGVITASTLTGNAGTGAAHLGIAANDVTTLGSFSADQGFGLNDTVPLLTVAGAVDGGTSVYLVNTGSLAIAAPVTATGIVVLVGNGIAQTAAGVITAGTLTGNAGAGAAHLGLAANDVTDLGAFAANQGFGLNDNTSLLTVTGAVDGGTSVYLVNTGSLAIAAPITATGLVDLVGTGIAQTAAGVITAGTLTGNAGTGAAHLGAAANVVTDLGAFTATQGFGLNDKTALLTVAGAVDGGTSVYLVNTGSLAIAAPITATGLVDLVGDGIAQTGGGTITAGTLTGDAGSGAANLGIATNDVTDLGAFTATTGFGLRDKVPLLTVTGAVDGGASVYLVNSGSLAIGAPVTASGIVDLVGEGVTQYSGGLITAGTLIGNAGTGAANIGITTNAVQNLGSFSAGNGFGLRDNAKLLTVTGPVDGGPGVYIVNTGSLALDAPVTARTGVVDLVANGIAQSQAGVITAVRLIGDAGSGAANLGVATNAVTTLGPFTATTGFGLRDAVPVLTVVGAVDGGPAVYLVNTGSVVLAASLAASNLVDLVGNGITQTGGAIATATLIGNAGTGAADLGGPANMVADLGPFAAATGFTFNDAATSTLTVAGAVDGGTGVAITTHGSLAIDAPVTASGTVDLVAAAGIAQTAGGVITANTLTGDAGTGLAYLAVATNAVQNLGPFTTAQGFALTDSVPQLTVVGAIAGGPAIYLGNTGSLAIDAPLTAADSVSLVADGIGQNSLGVITTATLIGSSGSGAADLGAATNLVQNLGPFTATTGVTLNDNVGTLTIAGAVNGGTGVSLTNTGSLVLDAAVSGTNTVSLVAEGISQSVAGIITAGTLTGDSGSGAADLSTAANVVTNLGPFIGSNGFSLNDNAPVLTVVGAVGGGPVVTLANTGSLVIDAPIDPFEIANVVLDANGISQNADGVIAGALSGSAGTGDADLAAASNLITFLGPFTADGAIRLLNGVGLAVTDQVVAGTDATITVTGSGNNLIINSATIQSGPAGTVALTASDGDIQNYGTVSGGALAILTAGMRLDQHDVVTAGAVTEVAGTDIYQYGDTTATAGNATLTAGRNILQVSQVIAAGNATLTAAGTLTQAGIVRAGGNAVLTATSGTLDQSNIVTAGNAATLTAGGDLSQTGTVTAVAGSASLTAAGNLTQSSVVTAGGDANLTATYGALAQTGAVTAGRNANLTATNGTLTQSGTVTAGNDATLTATNGTLYQIGIVAAGTSATLVAGADLSQIGTVTATRGNASLSAGGNLTQSSRVTAGADASLTATNGTLTQNGAVTAGSDAALTATNGTLYQNGIVTAGNAATLVAGADLAQIGAVTAGGGDATLTAGGNLTQSNIVTAGADAILTAINGTLTQTGAVTAGGNANLTATNGTLDQTGTVRAGNAATLVAGADLSQIGTVTAGVGDATLTAGGNLTQSSIVTAGNAATLLAGNNLAQTGAVTAGGNATLTATNGTLDQTGVVTAGGNAALTAGADLDQTGTLRAGGDVTLAAGGNLIQAATVAAGHDATLTADTGALMQTGGIAAGASAIIQALAGNLDEAGKVTAPNIQVAAPKGQVSFTGIFAGIRPDPSLDPHFRLKQGAFPSNMSIGAWISGSVIAVAPTAQVLGAGGGLSQLVVRLTNPGGTVDFANFQNPLTQLYLDLGTGFAAGQIAVDALQVQYVVPGTTQTIDLSGTVNGQSGSTAASASFILPLQKENYQVNGCPIESANCVQITTLTLPVINPLKDLEISTPDQADDILIILPDVGDRDY
jgi:filamentous hemagglutinin family protein